MILDLLDKAGVSWKVYNNGFDSVPYGNTDNVFLLWDKYQHDNRAHNPNGQFFNDLRRDELPQVSWIRPVRTTKPAALRRPRATPTRG
jgi:phospholipase C